MPAPVISNTGPLIALAEVGQLELLRHLFANIAIPPAVRAEILTEPAQSAVGAATLQGWILEQQPTDTGVIRLLNETLDLGESQAIALAQQINPSWVILDDLAARHIAEGLRLPVIGTIGVLLQAKNEGFISEAKQLLNQLRDHNLFISERLYRRALEIAGEA